MTIEHAKAVLANPSGHSFAELQAAIQRVAGHGLKAPN